MKKFAIAAATATALTLTMANVAFAQTQTTQAPMTLAAGEMTKAKEATSDTWITTKVKVTWSPKKAFLVPTSKSKPTKVLYRCRRLSLSLKRRKPPQ